MFAPLARAHGARGARGQPHGPGHLSEPWCACKSRAARSSSSSSSSRTEASARPLRPPLQQALPPLWGASTASPRWSSARRRTSIPCSSPPRSPRWAAGAAHVRDVRAPLRTASARAGGRPPQGQHLAKRQPGCAERVSNTGSHTIHTNRRGRRVCDARGVRSARGRARNTPSPRPREERAFRTQLTPMCFVIGPLESCLLQGLRVAVFAWGR